MQELPHRYSVAAIANPEEAVELQGGGLPSLTSAPPAEFDGPGDRWSPETLLVAASSGLYCAYLSRHRACLEAPMALASVRR